ncbi:hypothetical protein RCL1_007899 [Eukaryota sp. TZLM3-RCL]
MEWSKCCCQIVSVSANGVLKLERELSLMASLNHPLVIRVFGIVYLPQNRVGIVMERALHSLPAPTVTSPETLKHAIDIVNAVKYLHSMSIVHYDLKPANILISNNHIKLTDFGTSRIVSSNTTIATTAAFTPKYAAPECLEKKVSPQSDVYSIGVILYEILCGREAYSGYTIMEIFGAKCRPCTFEFGQEVPSELKAIIMKVCVDKTKRPSLDDILNVLTKLNRSFALQSTASSMTVNNTRIVFNDQEPISSVKDAQQRNGNNQQIPDIKGMDTGRAAPVKEALLVREQVQRTEAEETHLEWISGLRRSLIANKYLMEKIPKVNGEPHWELLEDVHTLRYYSRELESLEGLQLFYGLQTLFLLGCKVSDLTPILGLTELRELKMLELPVLDLSTLAACNRLETLYLSDMSLSDISPLSFCTNLVYLTLEETQVVDISPLSTCTKLRCLDLSDSPVSDISPLAGCEELTVLRLENTKVADISPLSTCTRLRELYLQDTPVSKKFLFARPLKHLTHLKIIK